MRQTLERVVLWWALLGGVGLLLIVGATAFNIGAFAADMVARRFGASVHAFPGYEDFVRLTVSAAVLMLFPYCQLRRGHVAVDLLVERMPQRVQRAIDAISLIGMTLLVLFLLYWMVIGMAETRADHAVSRVLGWPEWPFYLPGLVSLGALGPGRCRRCRPDLAGPARVMTEREIVGIVGLVVLFVLLMLRIPVGLTMIAVGIGGSYVLSLVAPHLRFEPYLRGFKTLLWNTVANYELSVVPLFVLMGFLAAHANLSRDLFQGVNALIGRLRGGVAMAAVGACASFGAVCGSSLATASTMGKVALPELKRMRYEGSFATGTLAAGGTLGILIPPSVPLVIYAIIVEASIIEMFQAAIVPGLIAVAGFIAVIALLVRLRPERAPAACRCRRTSGARH